MMLPNSVETRAPVKRTFKLLLEIAIGEHFQFLSINQQIKKNHCTIVEYIRRNLTKFNKFPRNLTFN